MPPPNVNGVIREPDVDSGPSEFILYMSGAADDMLPWGSGVRGRDQQLRNFWPTEPILASSVYTTAAKYAAFGWHLTGPPRTTRQVTRMLHGVERGAGWQAMIIKVLIDILTQDNGGFIELVRTEDSETAPVVSMNHLDAGRCIRTGVAAEPVKYVDLVGKIHLMKWYQVIALTEFPSPIEIMRGVQYCAVTRLLRAAQILRDISQYYREKISGKFHRRIYLVQGIQDRTIRNALREHQMLTDSQGLTRFTEPAIIGSLDPTANVRAEALDMASLPDGFDYEVFMRWYVNQLALAFGQDYADFAPLPGGNLGSAQQSSIGHLKGRGKGPRLFMTTVESAFNFQGVMPENVEFEFGDQDIAEDLDKVNLRTARAKDLLLRLQAGVISPEVARLMAVEDGDLDEKYLAMLVNYVPVVPGKTLPGTGGPEQTSNMPQTREPQNDGGRPVSNGQVTRRT